MKEKTLKCKWLFNPVSNMGRLVMKLKKTIMRPVLFCITMIIFNAIASAIMFRHISWLAALPGFPKFAHSFSIALALMYGEHLIIYDKWINALKLKEGQVWKKHSGSYSVYIEVQRPLNKKQIMVKRWVKDYTKPLRPNYSPMSDPVVMAIRQDKTGFYQAGWMALEGKEKAKFLLKI